MTPTTFSEIEPLLTHRRVDGESQTVHCVFTCPITSRQFPASAGIRQGAGLGDRLLDSTSESFWYHLRRKVADSICASLPHGFVKEVAEGAAWRMLHGYDDTVNSRREIDQATVDAFTSISDEFVRDGQGWIGREVSDDFANDFQRQLQRAPIATKYEARTSARALLALAGADGIVGAERQFLANYCAGPAEGAENFHAPTAVELSEVEEKVRPTIYMLACALSLTDFQQSESETAYLRQLERGFALDPDESRALRTAAGHFIVEQSVQLHLQPSQDDLGRLAKLAALSVEEVERVLVRRRKRAV